ncbi:DUF7659 family protein [Aliivibrio fischeri]|uniref:BCTnown n=1 Tax=Aliivibrio fischeri TaxID=668 RepID=A0A510UN52_ALIFS|nr:hypothetical protein [Aliivibrio fischeri]MUK51533.1 hypothetical protein [Aliivibrio fischeri]GEK16103.1 hypothetical protein AFI02nite_41390 [Aliivibrio fischeri]
MKYLSDFTQEKQTALFKETGAFFAFSQQQFEEEKVEGVAYVSLFAGLIVPKENAKKVIDGLEKINIEGVNNDLDEHGKKAIIRRELFNHECFYTGDISDCLDKLASYKITEKEIQAHYEYILKTEDVD